MPFTFHPEPSPLVNEAVADIYEAPFRDTVAASAREALKLTVPVQVYDQFLLRQARNGGDVLAQADYEGSDFFRPGIKWHEGMTEQEAEIMAERHDKTKRNNFIVSKGGIVPALVGGLLGSLPDPINFIPIFGHSARIAAAGRFGKTLGFGLVNAAEASIMTAAIQPLTLSTTHEFQETYDLRMAVESMAMAGVIGFGFGAIMSPLVRLPEEVRVGALSKSLKDVIEGRAVDISEVSIPRATIPDELKLEIFDALRNPDREISNDGGFGAGIEPDMTTRERARATVELLQKPEHLRTPAENHFLNTIDIQPEARRAINIGKLGERVRSKDDKAFLRAFFGDKLPDYYKNKIEGVTARLTKLRERYKKATGADMPEPDLARRLGGVHSAPDGVSPRDIQVGKQTTTGKVKEIEIRFDRLADEYPRGAPEFVLENRGKGWDVVALERETGLTPLEASFASKKRVVHGQGLKLAEAKKMATDILGDYDTANPARGLDPPPATRETSKVGKMLDEAVRLEGELGVYRSRLAEQETGQPLHYGVPDETKPTFPDVELTTEKTLNAFDDVEEIQARVSVIDEHLAAMEREGFIDEATKAELTEARAERAETNKMADAFDDAAICVVRNR